MADVKICGLTSRDDAMFALESGADYIGFVLYGKSPRGITPGKMADIIERLEGDFKAVGVFVNMDAVEVVKIARDCNLHAVQLHGDEMPADFTGLGLRIWRAVRVDADSVLPRPEEWEADRYVADADVPGEYGGTGRKADWEKVSDLAEKYPVILAGGLTPENVAEAIREVQPLGVDVASGVEKSPGKKDIGKIREFIRAAKIG